MAKRLIAIGLGVLVLIGASLPLRAGGAAFRVRFELVQTGPPAPDPRCVAPTVLVSFTGTGNGSRVGRVSAEASHCIVDDPSVQPFDHGMLRLVNARGEIFIEYEGTDTGGVLEGTFSIVGGTGAYAGVTGGGTLTGRASADEERGVGVLQGWID